MHRFCFFNVSWIITSRTWLPVESIAWPINNLLHPSKRATRKLFYQGFFSPVFFYLFLFGYFFSSHWVKGMSLEVYNTLLGMLAEILEGLLEWDDWN